MINYKKLNIHRQNLKEQHKKKIDEINELLQMEDSLEIICFLAFINYISLQEGTPIIEPSNLEYIICMSIKNWHLDNIDKKKDVENVLRVWQLGEKITRKWMEYTYYEKISEEDTVDDIERKMFAASMKISYGLTRGYSWYRVIEKKHISRIFEGINQKIEEVVGFYPLEAWEYVETYEKILTKRLKLFKEKTRNIILGSTSNEVEVYRKMYTYNYKELLGVTVNDIILENPSIRESHLRSFFEFFSIDLQLLEEYKYESIIDSSPYEDKPIIRFADRFFIPDTQVILWKLREKIEDKIKGTKFWSTYDKKNKAKYLEEASVDVFKRLLPQCQIYNSLFYYPEGCKSGCELDAIALYDNIIILIEAKSGIYSKSARRGGIERLKKNIEENIEKAYKQGSRTKEYIKNSDEAIFYEKNNRNKEVLRVKRKNYKHFFVVNTTLDYYAELGIDLYRLQELGIYKEKEFPWTICLSDLEVIGDFIDFPNQFIYYLMLRSNINNSLSKQNHIKMLYELDLFAMYKLENTDEFSKYECEAVDEKILLDIFEKDTEKDILQAQQYVCYDFSTYFFKFYDEYYINEKMSNVPKKIYNRRYLEMCRQLEEYRTVGYSDFIFRFLDLDLEHQNWLMNEIDKICEKSYIDKKMHTLSIKKMPRQFLFSDFGMVVYVGYTKERSKIEKLAYAAGTIQQGLTGIKDWIILCIYLDDKRHFINQFYYHFGNKESEEIGNSIAQHIPIKKNRKTGRNELCPCGSGKKYKFCCGR